MCVADPTGGIRRLGVTEKRPYARLWVTRPVISKERQRLRNLHKRVSQIPTPVSPALDDNEGTLIMTMKRTACHFEGAAATEKSAQTHEADPYAGFTGSG